MTQEINEIKELVKNVEGYFGDIEGAFLYSAAKTIKGRGIILEIGSWKGKSTIWLAKASLSGPKVKVYAVDPHTGSPEHKEQFGTVDTFSDFKQNIERAGVTETVIPIVKTSMQAAQEWDGSPIEFLWIDGAHEYEMVKQDFDLWSPYVVEGGTIAFHDTGLRSGTQGPKEFVEQHIFPSRFFKDVRFYETITIATKVSENTVLDRIKNLLMLCLKRVYQQVRRMKFYKPVFLRRLANKLVHKY